MILDRLRADSGGGDTYVGPLEAFLRHGSATLSKAGLPVTFDGALRIAAVYACVRIISEAMASLPLIIYRRIGDDGKERFRQHPLYRVLRRKANSIQTAFEWMETVMIHLLLRGNHYSLKVRVNGNITELAPRNPDLVSVRVRGGRLEYELRPDPELGESGAAVTLGPDRLLHYRGKSSNGYSGRSVIQDACDVMGASMALDEHTAGVFRNGANLGGVIEYPNTLGDEEFEKLRKSFKEDYASSKNSGGWFIADGGAKAHTLAMTNDDAQLIETHKFQIAQIARFFGVPLHKLLDNVSQPRANMEQMAAEWIQDGLRPWATRLEQATDDQLLGLDDDVFCQFLFEDMLRGDLAARTAHYTAMFGLGLLNRDEIRAKENMNPLGGGVGEKRYHSLQLLPMDEDGNTAQPAQPAQEVN